MSQGHKRGRRPIDDNPHLLKAADMMVGDTSLKPTTAFRRIGVKDSSALRRLQVKWQASGPALLEAAHGRKAELEKARREAALSAAAQGNVVFGIAGLDLGKLSALMQSAREWMESPTFRRHIEEWERIGPALKPFGEAAVRLHEQLEPLLRALEPLARRLEPSMRLALEHQERLNRTDR
ncbi:hypothetical protein D3093_33955 (plasmid) [Azospirillum argentinense]|uniref:Uncharacterized protein n=1 Tax=Azospirillum argentinense TaxID=2970906 RepID=A0A4D8PSD5_9PROT|nr:hypothetical protein [Azospirillum argentinense]QCO00245.1 hypothetical protein D3093_33955 [Azospirillum argentinense]